MVHCRQLRKGDRKMAKKSKLTVKDLKRICDIIGKKGKDGKPITEDEIRQWDSVIKEGCR
jgi:hypothetical protein